MNTVYQLETPAALIQELEKLIRTRARVIITYGDPKTGKVWELNRGMIGRSTGEKPIPLLVKTKRSLGGEALLDSCILKLVDVKSKAILYDAPLRG